MQCCALYIVPSNNCTQQYRILEMQHRILCSAFIPTVSRTCVPTVHRTAAVSRRLSSFARRSPLARPRVRALCARTTHVIAMTGDAPASAVAESPAEMEPKITYLTDYKKPNYLVDEVRLEFDLDDTGLDTKVYSTLTVHADCPAGTPLVLDGEKLELISGSLKVDGSVLPSTSYIIDGDSKTLTIVADALPVPGTPFKLETAVRIAPAKNTALEGLYMSSGNYCTQCEGKLTIPTLALGSYCCEIY